MFTLLLGSVMLLDARDNLEGLKCAKGLVKWKVVSKDLDVYENFEQVPEKWSTQIRPQMFPPKEDVHNLTKW